MTDKETFAERLKRLRKAAGLSQEKLSNSIQVSFMTLRRWETGLNQPRLEEIQKLAAALPISEDELLNGRPEATWVLRVEIKTEKEDFIDLKALKNKPISTIATYSDAGFLQLGGGYELWTNDKLFNDMIKQFKKLRDTVIQNGKALGGIKD